MTTTHITPNLVDGISQLLLGMFVGSVVGVVLDGTLVICGYAAKGGTIQSLNCATTAGTTVLALKINGTNVTGLSAVTASSVRATTNASAANVYAAGDLITLVLSSSSGDCANLDWTVAMQEATS